MEINYMVSSCIFSLSQPVMTTRADRSPLRKSRSLFPTLGRIRGVDHWAFPTQPDGDTLMQQLFRTNSTAIDHPK